MRKPNKSKKEKQGEKKERKKKKGGNKKEGKMKNGKKEKKQEKNKKEKLTGLYSLSLNLIKRILHLKRIGLYSIHVKAGALQFWVSLDANPSNQVCRNGLKENLPAEFVFVMTSFMALKICTDLKATMEC